MEPARTELAEAINATAFKAPVCPIYQNVTAASVTDPEAIKANLIAQLTAPVRWTQTVVNMLADGADNFTEVGPGSALQGMIKKVDRSVVASGISTFQN
jgi:[acyl-carrier-protein] S-malonyltransferase